MITLQGSKPTPPYQPQVGRITCDHDTTYARKTGCCFIVHAKLWGIYHNLILAKKHGLLNVIVESDALKSITMIQNEVCSARSNVVLYS